MYDLNDGTTISKSMLMDLIRELVEKGRETRNFNQSERCFDAVICLLELYFG